MAKRRILKKNINGICGELFLSCAFLAGQNPTAEKKEQAKPDPQLELLTEIRDLLRQQAQTSAPEQEILPRLEEEEHGH